MVKFTVSKALFRNFPQLKIGVIVINNFSNKIVAENVLARIKDEEKRIKQQYQKDKLSEIENIKVWRTAYSSFGAKPKKYKSSIEALTTRILEGESIPSINNLVNIYNYISIKYMMPLGADDLGKAKQDVFLTYAQGTEQFKGIGTDEVKTVEKGEVVYKSGNDVLCRRWNYRESDLTKIDENSTRAILYCESLLQDQTTLQNAMNELKELVNGQLFFLDSNNNSIDADSLQVKPSDYDEFHSHIQEQQAQQQPKEKKEKKVAKDEESSRSSEAVTQGSMDAQDESMHWADQMARKVVKVKGEKQLYTCAAGITPSGVVHIGNFREMITVDLVVRALRDLGKNVRFIYSWDDYDVFRKVPKGWPKQEELAKELRKPIVDVFDPYGCCESFAAHNENAVEKELPALGIKPTFIYQAKQYRQCAYAEGMRKALENTAKIRAFLDKYREEPLPEDWLPIMIFDDETDTDEVSDITYLGGYLVSYKDKFGKEKTFDFSKDRRSKLLWRVDWPMRWAHEQVDFEPGGKDHSTEGGSYSTAVPIAKEVYGVEAPLYIMYDFISVKGQGGKISSSLGNVITIHEVLEIYEPAITRYLFAGTRPNTEFAISFDLDVLKIYEDFDKVERVYYGIETDVTEKEKAKQSRIYELSAVGKPLPSIPLQPGFRHLTTLLQVYENNFDKLQAYYKDQIKNENDLARLKIRAQCAWNWLQMYAPDTMKFKVVDTVTAQLNDKEKKMVLELKDKLAAKDYNEEELFNEFYGIIKANNSNPNEFFAACYKVLINKERGPKLAPFILEIGKEKVVRLLGMV